MPRISQYENTNVKEALIGTLIGRTMNSFGTVILFTFYVADAIFTHKNIEIRYGRNFSKSTGSIE